MDQRDTGIGFFGKVPSHGDFVARRLPPDLIGLWDGCLQAGLKCSQERLGKRWLPAYLNFPLWHFVLSRSVCGNRPWAGLLMPSVDKVGRYYPLLVAGPLLDQRDGRSPDAPVCNYLWYEQLENLSLSALEPDFLLERFDAALEEMHQPRQVAAAQLIASASGSTAGALQAIAGGQGARCSAPETTRSLFWHQPLATDTAPTVLACPGLPDAAMLASMLEGSATGVQDSPS